MGKFVVHRLDANATEIKYALKRIGATVDHRCPGDWLVGFQGKNYILEIKTKRGRQLDSQKAFEEAWRGQYALVRTVEEAFEAIGFKPVPVPGKH